MTCKSSPSRHDKEKDGHEEKNYLIRCMYVQCKAHTEVG